MASYTVVRKKSAARELRRLPDETVERIIQKINELSCDPFSQKGRKIHGTEGTYRWRVGSYRILYTINASGLEIKIVRVGHRKDVYRE